KWDTRFSNAGSTLVLLAATLVFVNGFLHERDNPVLHALAPFDSFNNYGLFAVMTTSRPEIIIEGSADGQTWKEYEFRYKPGDVARAPQWNAPHQPRLDWQMWFAALGNYRHNPWLLNFMVRLQEGQPSVTALLKKNPFAQAPPRYVRALL